MSQPTPGPGRPHHVDPDFARDVLGDLYAYRRKHVGLAWLFWGALGWAGGHRFYLERTGTGLLQLLTGGGVLAWWLADARRLGSMVETHNREQARREAAGEPPMELDFMPPLAGDVLAEPPEWTRRWRERGRAWRGLRLLGDLLVLMVAGASLGALTGMEGGAEATFAVITLIAVTLLGGQAEWLNDVPLARALVRWSHRLRLFYYFNRPGSPPGLLIRPVLGLILAPFRRRGRAETRLYLELGAAFTVAFLAVDAVEDVLVPLFGGLGLGAVSPFRLGVLWFQELFTTFFITYAFASPIGAVLTRSLLTRRTHTMPRVLGAFTLLFIALTSGVL